jgi:diguanylate cyclase (GGDEF)-like protein
MIDVDDLKHLNDSHGHSAGDAALLRVAKSVAQRARREDQLFRWGGDEFLLVALGVDPAELTDRLDLVNRELSVPDPLTVRVSYGAAAFGDAGELLDAVKRADANMYASKRVRAGPKRSMDRDLAAAADSKAAADLSGPAGDPGNCT